MYRTYGSVRSGSNLLITCLLLHLEDRIRRFGRLPPTIFLQVDGGSENCNRYVFAMCELLIARSLTQRIFLSRLPVGHTHEDMYGKFGKLWFYIRKRPVLSPQVQTKRLEQCFGNTNESFAVVDIFAVIDYKSFLHPYIDDQFSR
jgi:hypothetical protein